MTDERALEPTPVVSAELVHWEGAAKRALQARREREEIISSVLVPGVDYGVIPGTDKPTLYKSGAEKVADCLNLCADYETVNQIEQWDPANPLFVYAFRCRLIYRGAGVVVATGLGSCNSLEDKYRWRSATLTCPSCGKATVFKSKPEKGEGWFCWAKKGGCGANFKADDPRITGQPTDKVPNQDVFTQVNTMLKMAQKRALVAAVLNLGFSEKFTQDMEDMAVGMAAGGIAEDVQPVSTTTTTAAEKDKPSSQEGRDENGPFYRGFIQGVAEKSGQTKGKAWTLFLITTPMGDVFTTFDEAIKEEAKIAAEEEIEVILHFEQQSSGRKTVKGIAHATEGN